jgi:hypothetical protein
MDIWWIVLILFVLATITVLTVVRRNSRKAPGPAEETPAHQRDFVEERETSRLTGMDEEDRAWQTASLEKDREQRAGDSPA